MFSQTAEYAFRAMIHIASADPVAPLSSEAIARRTHVPKGYLSKVLRDLVVAELIRSQRGPSGGFRLARPAAEISMLDVINAVDPLSHIHKCPLGNPAHLQLCPLHRRMEDATALMEREFARTSLAEMSETNSRAAQCRSLLAAHEPLNETKEPPARAAKRRAAPNGR